MIVSDHGMTSGGTSSAVEYVDIDDYVDLDDVSLIIDRAAIAAVAPLPGKTDKVIKNSFQALQVDYVQFHEKKVS